MCAHATNPPGWVIKWTMRCVVARYYVLQIRFSKIIPVYNDAWATALITTP